MQKVNGGIGLLISILLAVAIGLAATVVGRQLSMMHSASVSAGPSGSKPAGTTVQPGSGKASEYHCQMAKPRPGSASAYRAKTWILLGDEFAAGYGSSSPAQNSYHALLEAMAREQTGYGPTIINAVGSNPGNLPEQIRLLRQSSSFRAVVAANEPILLFVSYGAGWLSTQYQASGDASLYVLDDQLRMIAGGNASLISADIATHFQAVVMSHPDPSFGGVAVPEQYAICAYEPSLNRPTLASRDAHNRIVYDSTLMLSRYAKQQGYAFVDVDAALGAYSIAQKRYDSDLTTFRDCYTYNDLGHSFLADMLWQCMSNRTYSIPVKQ